MNRSTSWRTKPSRRCLPGRNSRSRHATSLICAPPAIFVAESGLFWTLRPETAEAALAYPVNPLLIIIVCLESIAGFHIEWASRPLEPARSYPNSQVDPWLRLPKPSSLGSCGAESDETPPVVFLQQTPRVVSRPAG